MTKQTHWRKILNTDYLGGFDLADDQGKFNDIVVTIKDVKRETVKDQNGKEDVCLVAHFKESVKPMILNVTNSKTITKLLKTPYIERWAGNRIQIGTEKVKAFGEIHDALRVRNYPPKETAKTSDPIVPCVECGEKIRAGSGATVQQVINGTEKTYGVKLCLECAGRRKAKDATEQ